MLIELLEYYVVGEIKETYQVKLSFVSTDCGVGVKQNSKGNREVWIGGKLHISAVDKESGIFFDKQSVESLKEAVERFEHLTFEPQKISVYAKKFSVQRFKEELIGFEKALYKARLKQ